MNRELWRRRIRRKRTKNWQRVDRTRCRIGDENNAFMDSADENMSLVISTEVMTELDELISEDILRDSITAVLELHGIPYGEVSVLVVSEKEIKRLNSEQREIDKVTDVLSFPQYNNLFEIAMEPYPYYGDIVLCAKRAAEQAEEFGHSFLREVSYLTVHSMLHLLGYDHMEEDDKVEMRAMEKIVMKRLGIFKNEMIQLAE